MSRAFRLGLFIVAAMVIFFAGVFWVGSKKFLFAGTYHLYADFPNVAGLDQGAEVRVGGVHQGTVKRIDLPHRPDDQIRLEMDMKTTSRDVVKKDSLAMIRSEGLVGDRYVEVSFGSGQAPKVNDGDTIRTEPPLEISDLIKKTNKLLDSAQGAMQDVDATAGNLKQISGKINQGTGTMGALINDKSVYQHMNRAATELQEDMEALKHNFFLRGFFRKRGYEDAAELASHQIARVPARPPSRQFSFRADKLFDKPDSANLRKGKALNEAGKFLEGNSYGLAVVAAYTDMKGDTKKGKELTEARAMVVRDYLVSNFKLQDTRLKTIGLAKSPEANSSGMDILVYPVGDETLAREGATGNRAPTRSAPNGSATAPGARSTPPPR